MQINDITVVRGYKKEMVTYPGITTIDNDQHDSTSDLMSLYLAKDKLEGPMIISYGDILFKPYALDHLRHTPGSIKILVDADTRNDGRNKDLVTCSEPYSNDFLHNDVKLTGMSVGTDITGKHGAWMGVIMTDANGTIILKETMEDMAKDPNFKSLSLTDLLDRLSKTYTVSIAYIKGGWIGVNDSQDYESAKVFSC
jgi:phosphoenolpyruvate phosphomutase